MLVFLLADMDLSEEEELVKRAQRDRDAFARLYDQYYPRIFGYVLRRSANLEAAQDITSETFLKALGKLWQFQWRNVSFSSWLYKIATNEINQYFRKAEYKKSVSLEELQERGFELLSPHDPENELIEAQEKLKQHQDFLEIQGKIARLPAKYQEVIALRFFEKRQIKEIAEILGKREGTIKSLLHRAVEKLREMD
ncbi:MAG: sigma-70 family RNA polymerase sigma factor [Dehalococcoidia bacterium]|nr:sigma-70 family RNA polymerase sigma factor [Dehalococcoidia bacterium]